MASKIHLCLLFVCSLMVASNSEVNMVRFERRKRALYSLNENYEVPLNYNGTYFVTTISVGTPAQKLQVAFDLEKSYSWLLGTTCSTSYCNSRTKYNQGASSTFKNKNKAANVTYRDTSVVSGKIFTDTATLGTLKINSQDFILGATTNGFESEPYDGLIGLAPTTNAKATDLLTPLENLVKEKLKPIVNSTIHSFLFGKKRNVDAGVLILGGINQYFYKPPIYFKQCVTKGVWRISTPFINLTTTISSGEKNTQLLSKNVGIGFDTSIDYIGAPASAFAIVQQYTGGSVNQDGKLEFNCGDLNILIYFQMTNVLFNLPSKSLVDNDCVINMVSIPQNYWVMGLPFLKNYFSVYDAERGMVGLATPLPLPGTNSG